MQKGALCYQIAEEIAKKTRLDDFEDFCESVKAQYMRRIRQYGSTNQQVLEEQFYDLNLQELYTIRPD